MAKIYEFKSGGKSPHHREGDYVAPTSVNPTTPLEVFLDAREDVLGEWQRNAVKNCLNEYFYSKIPYHARGEKNLDFVNSLDALGYVEQRLLMIVASFYPTATPNNPYGYLAAFTYAGEIYTTSPDIMSEANARALNILCYLRFTQQMELLGLGLV